MPAYYLAYVYKEEAPGPSPLGTPWGTVSVARGRAGLGRAVPEVGRTPGWTIFGSARPREPDPGGTLPDPVLLL